MAAEGDFVIALYNLQPRSGDSFGRNLRDYPAISRSATPTGIVRKAGRAGMSYTITDLANLAAQDVDMQSTVIIGNSRTRVEDGRIITPARV